MSLELKQLVNVNEDILNTITTWMYNWWGKRDGYSFEKVKCFMKHSMMEKRLPQTYGLFLDGKIIGIYQFGYEDLSVRPDIYPWLANVYIDESYRGKGYGRKLLETQLSPLKLIWIIRPSGVVSNEVRQERTIVWCVFQGSS